MTAIVTTHPQSCAHRGARYDRRYSPNLGRLVETCGECDWTVSVEKNGSESAP